MAGSEQGTNAGRITVIGAGATGGYVAARLARAGLPVTVVARGRTKELMSRDGIHVTEPDGSRFTDKPDSVVELSELRPGSDAVALFCVKGYATLDVLREAADVMKHYRAVVCLQNGVANEERLSTVVPRERILAGVLYLGAARTQPNEIVCTADARLHIGPYDGAKPDLVTDVAEILGSSGLETHAEDDALSAKWQKFLFNCALNPLTAVTKMKLGPILATREGASLFAALLDEAIATAEKVGAPLPTSARQKVLETAERMNISSSMAEDLEAGRQIEIDEFTGHVLSMADASSAPVTAVFDSLLRVLSKRSDA